MTKSEIKAIIERLTNHKYIKITQRGNSAIKSVLSLVSGTVLIPAEGGWRAYQNMPGKLGLKVVEVACDDAKIDLNDLKEKLSSIKPGALIYQNPGGYFAAQPMEEIYQICQENNCLVIVDVSGGIGTKLCDGNYADLLVGSFGKWKLVDASAGGFISFKEKVLFDRAKPFIEKLDDKNSLKKIKEKLDGLDNRIIFLRNKIKKIKDDLDNFNLIRAGDLGFVVVVKFITDAEKETIINYCKDNSLEWTECPRYIRIKEKAISIEVKRK